ncbi:phosphatase PAP2 family protein [bacterium]|nr:phosphatase PAP2 family protein [bacterium]
MAFINSIEIIVNEVLQSLGVWLRWPMQVITALGYEQFFVLLLPVIYWCMDQAVGLRVGIALLLGTNVNTFFKFLFHNPRPFWISDNIITYSHESSFGLPSGHAQVAATVWGWLAVEVKKRWFTIAAIALIFLIGFSRLYLGVHFLSDVLLGWLLGGLLVLLMFRLRKPVADWFGDLSLGAKLAWILVSTVMMTLLVLGARWLSPGWLMPTEWAPRAGDVDPFSLNGTFTISGTWLGMLSGYVLLMEKKGPFLAGEGDWRRLARLFVGLIGIGVLYLGLGQIFPDNADFISYALRVVRYVLIGLWVSWWGPVVFEKFDLLQFKSAQELD